MNRGGWGFMLAGCALAIGVYAGLIRPMERRLTESRAALAHAGRADRAAAASTRTSALALERATTLADAIESAGAAARDQRILAGELARIGADLGVTIENVSTNRNTADDPRDTVLASRITASGPYRSIADFVRAIEEGPSLARVSSVRVSPSTTARGDRVVALIRAEHLAVGLDDGEEPTP